MMRPLYVDGLSFLGPVASLADWPEGPRVELAKPSLEVLDRSLRRGLSEVTRLFMHAAGGALEDAGEKANSLPLIFASAFGEIATAEALLEQAYDENTSSPARFRNSVHNTAVGLFSISAHNTLPATAIAAGWATTAIGLLEASMILSTTDAERVLLVFAEEAVPVALSAEHAHGGLGVGMVLSHAQSPRSKAMLHSLRREPVRTSREVPFGAENHPLGPALSLAREIAVGNMAELTLSDDEPPYVVTVTPLQTS